MEKETGLQEKEQADMWTDIGFPVNYYMTLEFLLAARKQNEKKAWNSSWHPQWDNFTSQHSPLFASIDKLTLTHNTVK